MITRIGRCSIANNLIKSPSLSRQGFNSTRRASSTFGMLAPKIASRAQPQTITSPSNRLLSTSSISQTSFPKASIPEWASEEASQAVRGLVQKFYPENQSEESSTTVEPATSFVQVLDENQLNLLKILLDEMIPLSDQEESSISTQSQISSNLLSPSEHLVYFTPTSRTSTLGKDGSDTTFNPPGGVFVRRMWAGGQMIWSKDQPLKVDDKAKEDTFIEEISVKKTKEGNEMLLVWVRKEYRIWNGSEWSDVLLQDRRSWVYQKALSSTTSFKSTAPQVGIADSSQSIRDNSRRSDQIPACFTSSNPTSSTPTSTSLIQSPTHLFRYSGLTYNGHAIHLCPIWAKEQEGHKERVVHGPLNLNLIMRQFEKRFGNRRKVLQVDYRAKNPVYVGEEYLVRFKDREEVQEEVGEGRISDELEIVKTVGEREILVMEAQIVSQNV